MNPPLPVVMFDGKNGWPALKQSTYPLAIFWLYACRSWFALSEPAPACPCSGVASRNIVTATPARMRVACSCENRRNNMVKPQKTRDLVAETRTRLQHGFMHCQHINRYRTFSTF